MKLDLEVNYTLQLSSVELRLISAALRGTLKEDQKQAAAELQIRIAQTKIAVTKSFMHEIEKLEKNMKGE